MKNDLGVFDFKEEDELAELAAGKLLEKFKNPNNDDSPVLKHQFLQNFTEGADIEKEAVGNVGCVDVDSVDSDQSCYNATPAAEEEQGPDGKKNDQVSQGSSLELKSKDFSAKAISPDKNQLNCSFSVTPNSHEPVDMMSADDESLSDPSTSSSSFDTTECNDPVKGLPSNPLLDRAVLEDMEMEVVMTPDYVMFRDNYCTTAVVIFSHSGIHVKGSATDHNQGSFSLRLGLEEIINIDYKWFQRVGLVIIKLRGLLKDAIEAENTQGTLDIEELKFAVVEPNWPEKQVKINSLNVKYPAVWSGVLDAETEAEADELPPRSHYFPEFRDHFEDVVYPKDDPDAVSISKSDVDLLQPETFINDTIIDFYIKYLKNQIQTGERHRFHFFNSFFFRKLADLDKDPSSISDGRAAFLRVRKWTRKVDMFGKDYVFIPVNFNLHWSLIVVCHPGEVASFRDEDTDKASKVPCILHMDSIRGSHAGLKNLVQSYLCEEWKERNKETSEDVSSKFLNLRFVSLELPQQENSFDCGLFLLHYLELFLSEAPLHFSPFKITQRSCFLNADWFPPAEASLKRTLIQKLIFDLLENCSPEVECDWNQSSKIRINHENEIGVEVLSQRLGLSTASHRNVSASQDGHGIEMTLLETSSMRNFNSSNDSGMVLRELFDQGATAGALFGQLQSFENPSSLYHLNSTISPRQQLDAETSDQFVCMTHQVSEVSAPAGSLSFSSRSFGADTSWNLRISMPDGHEIESESDTATCCSDDSEDMGIIEGMPMQDFNPNCNTKTEQHGPLTGKITPLSKDLETSKNEISHCSDEVLNCNEDEDHPCSHECPTISLDQETNTEEILLPHASEIVENKSETSGTTDNHVKVPQEQQAAKRPRLNPPVED